MQSIIDTLKSRGLFEAMTDPGLAVHTARSATVYAGFDPSADSLQVGNLVAVMGLRHFQRLGHRVICLIGGATGMIGDPSGKSAERSLLEADTVARNAAGIRENLTRLLDGGEPLVQVVDNADWFGHITFIDFLRDVGRHFRMGTMLGKDSVRTRLSSESGMSFTEFSYQLLQGYDFLHLYRTAGCSIQLGGSDQWGNITAGTELVRRIGGGEAFGLTLPLVCDSAGQKFGKSAGNAIYLSAERTPVHDFYQFFIRTADVDAMRFLRIFTILDDAELEALERLTTEAPEQRAAQRRLAAEVTRWVHGDAGLRLAERSAAILYGEAMDGLRADELLAVFREVPSATLPPASVLGAPLVQVAVESGLCQSRGEARRLIENGGLYLNNRRVGDVAAVLDAAAVIDDVLIVLRSGKKRYQIVRLAG